MASAQIQSVWQIAHPAVMPGPPTLMSFSALKKLELCPRQWALESAHYPTVWNRHGYPTVPATAALEGTIVHAALEQISTAFAKHGCASVHHDAAPRIIETLGGYSAIIQRCIAHVISRYESNPRAVNVLDAIKQSLLNRISDLRSRIQRHISRLRPVCGSRTTGNVTSGQHDQQRRAITDGVHAEVDLRVPALGWYGIADLLTISDVDCEIRDFKTGERKAEHDLQLTLYALLWARDHERNPQARLATRLVLSYDTEEVLVPPPDAGSLDALEVELRNRTANAIDGLQASLPLAKPDKDSCSFCSVRHMCEDYWKWLDANSRTLQAAPAQFGDIDVTVTKRHGPTSWDGVVNTRPGKQQSQIALIRTQSGHAGWRTSQRIRILNAHLTEQQGEEFESSNLPVVVTITSRTEVFSLG